jgi:predicted metal-dependent peptidase
MSDQPEENKATQQDYEGAAEGLKIAKITMMMQRDTHFYTAILFSLKQLINEEVPTAATDGYTLLINPLFFFDLTVNERIALLAHEALHVALDHMHRRGNREPKLWNVAADYVINYHLTKAGYKLPKGGLYDAQYEDMSTEQVYDLLAKKRQTEQDSIINKCDMDVQYPENAKDPGSAVTKDQVTDIVLRATTQAKAMGQKPGSLPGEIDIELQRTLNPPLPWDIILSNYLTSFAKDDYTFKRANKRFMPEHYLPTAHSEAVCNFAVAVDESCSVSDEEFNDCITKIAEVIQTMNPDKVTVASFNTRMSAVQEVDRGEDPFKKLKFKGRGGTLIDPVHKWLADLKPTVALIFSDGQFTKTEPINKSIPLIWLIYNNPGWTNDFGRVINYDIPHK